MCSEWLRCLVIAIAYSFYACSLVLSSWSVCTAGAQGPSPRTVTITKHHQEHGTSGSEGQESDLQVGGLWVALVKSGSGSEAGLWVGSACHVRYFLLLPTDSFMPLLVPCRTSCTLPTTGMRPQGLDGRLGAAGGAEAGRVCYSLVRRSL